MKIIELPEGLQVVKCLYRKSRDGAAAADFHRMCDKKGRTLTVVKVSNGLIIGGFTEILWDGINNYVNSITGESFLFVLKGDMSTIKCKCLNWK
jgi:hypothetical protein